MQSPSHVYVRFSSRCGRGQGLRAGLVLWVQKTLARIRDTETLPSPDNLHSNETVTMVIEMHCTSNEGLSLVMVVK